MITLGHHPQMASNLVSTHQGTQSASQNEHEGSLALFPQSLTDRQHPTHQPPPPANLLLAHGAPTSLNL